VVLSKHAETIVTQPGRCPQITYPGQFGFRFTPVFCCIGSFALTFPHAKNTVEKIRISGFSHWTSTLIPELDRRQFLSRTLAAASATWTVANWPAVLAAAEHAHKAAAAPDSQKLEFLTPAEAKEVAAISACIIPSDGTPGAREAGVVYFIDRALVTFASDDQKTYREGLTGIQKRLKELFPAATTFSAAAPEQQEAVLESLDEAGSKNPPRRPRANFMGGAATQFFEAIRAHTLAGFLIDPESDRRGNSGGVGWTVIGRLPEHAFQPPFGYYDQGYAGWQPASAAKEPAKND
jgi:Gluconate 2-dehydrogenase subunit 3